jgi:hypothetical protein
MSARRPTKSGGESAGRKPARPPKPSFNKDLYELSLGDRLVHRFDARAVGILRILAAFQEENWPPRIDDPLPPKAGRDGKAHLRDIIHNLNVCQRPQMIRFSSDGSGSGVRWELV